MSDLESELQAKNADEAELRQRYRQAVAQSDELEKSISKIVPKYHAAVNERGLFEKIANDAAERETILRSKHDRREADITKLKARNLYVEEELKVARELASASEVPEVAEFAKLREEIFTLKEEKERQRKKAVIMDSDLEYMRAQYQQSSSRMAELDAEVKGYEKEMPRLKHKASENAVRIHQIQRDRELADSYTRQNLLKAEKDMLITELDKKVEEIKALTNGRRNTRGSAPPQSPRVSNATASPSARTINQRAFASNSRANSPAPSEPLRSTFSSDAMLSAASNPRWPREA